MTAQRYTEAALPEVEAMISDTVAEISNYAQGVSGLESLLLGGSLGRGEATVELSASGPRLLSDVEVYLVGHSRSLRMAATQLEQVLRDKVDAEVSAAWLHPRMLREGKAKNLSWRSCSTIRLYELAAGSRVVLGNPPRIKRVRAASLPVDEGVRLILNRLAEATPKIVHESVDAGRWVDKILIACGDTVLLAGNRYTVSYRQRADRLRTASSSWDMPTKWRSFIGSAYERKLSGGTSEVDFRRVDEVVVATLSGAISLTLNEPLEPLSDFVVRFVRCGARRTALLRYLPPIGPAATYEGLVLLARVRQSRQRLSAKALLRALFGRPLSLTLQATALPLFLGVVRRDGALIKIAKEALVQAGVPTRTNPREAVEDLSDLLFRYWRVAA